MLRVMPSSWDGYQIPDSIEAVYKQKAQIYKELSELRPEFESYKRNHEKFLSKQRQINDLLKDIENQEQ